MDEEHGNDFETLSDELLAIRCLLGEAGGVDELVARWHEPLWSYLRRLLGEDDLASDTMQVGWLRILRALPQLRDPARLRPWLFGIVRRAAMDHLRERYAEPIDEDADPSGIAAPSDDIDRREDLEAMHDELTRLPAIERDVLVLFYRCRRCPDLHGAVQSKRARWGTADTPIRSLSHDCREAACTDCYGAGGSGRSRRHDERSGARRCRAGNNCCGEAAITTGRFAYAGLATCRESGANRRAQRRRDCCRAMGLGAVGGGVGRPGTRNRCHARGHPADACR